MPHVPHFFVLEVPKAGTPEDNSGGTRATKAEGRNMGEAPRCQACGRFIGLLTWLPPFRVEIEAFGRDYGDVVPIGNDLLVTQRFKAIYEGLGLTGLTSFELVEIINVRQKSRLRRTYDPPLYFKTGVIRPGRTAVAPEASGYEWEGEGPTCPVCLIDDTLRRYARIVIDSRTWAGEDIFYPRGGGVNFVVSERFKNACESHDIRNACFIPTEEYSYDYSL